MQGHEALASWESFYVIVGSSGAALTGLQFVVIALIAETESSAGSHELATYGTPTVLHFGAVLLIAAILSAPWPSLTAAATAVGIVGFIGTVYAIITAMRTGRAKAYKPVAEDWIWHVILPFAAYVGLLSAAIVLPQTTTVPLFTIAGSSLLLLFIGIHNAWDTVTYITLNMRRRAAPAQSQLRNTTDATTTTDTTKGPASS